MPKLFKPHELEIIRNCYKNYSCGQIAKQLSKHPATIVKKIREIGLKKPKKVHPFEWTYNEVCLLRENYPTKGAAETAKIIGKTIGAVRAKVFKLGLKSSFNKGQFKPKHKTWNKGKKGIHLCPATEFKKGHQPTNTKKDGAFSVGYDNGIPTVFYKAVGVKKMVHYARYVWEQINGKIPDKHIIKHKDGNRENCNIENLQLIHRRELVKLNRNIEKFSATMKRKNAVKRYKNNLITV